MKKIKDWIINKLGGHTEEEYREGKATSFASGQRFANVGMLEFLKELNGKSAEEWCDEAWKFITSKVNG